MRLIVLATCFAFAGCAALPYHEPPRPIIVLVHGRGHLGQDTAMLRRDWKRDLDSSLTSAGMWALRDEDVRLAWYADILDPYSESLCGTAETSDDSLGFADLARGFLALISSAAPREETRDVRGLMGDMMYVLDGAKRCAAERRVGSVITSAMREGRPVIVVAYSLGSLVTYGWLTADRAGDTLEAPATGPLQLITVGSPLGVRVIREIVYGEDPSARSLRVPAIVRGWENVYDPNDVLSAPLGGLLGANRVRDHATHASESEDAHNFDRYLRDPATGDAVMRALCEVTARQSRGCAKS